MALIVKDRVKETTTTTGTGTITLAGASTGFRSFADIGNANTTYYCISGGSQFEVGIGTYTASGTTLSRDTVLSNSLGTTAKIDFSAGTKDVFVTYPSDKALLGTTSAVASTGTGSVVLSDSPTITGSPSIGVGESNYIAIGFATYDSEILPSATVIGGNVQINGDPTLQSVSSEIPFTFNSGITANDLTASQAVFTDSFKNLVNKAVTGTGDVVLSTGPTITGGATINATTQALNIGTTQTTGTLDIGGTSATGTITLGRSNATQVVNMATGGAAFGATKTVNIGTQGASASTTNINIGNSSTGGGALTFGQATGTQTTNIQAGATASGSTKTMSIGTGGLAGSTTNIAIGSTTGTSTTTLNGAVSLSATTQNIDIGGTSATGAINIGRSTSAQTIQIGGTGNIVTVGGTTGTQDLTFGRSTRTQTVNIATGETASGFEKFVYIGKGGLAGSFTNIQIGTDDPSLTGITLSGAVYFNTSFGQNPIAVSALPAVGSVAIAGDRNFVNNALAPVFGSIVVGGGTVKVPVYCDGTDWRVG
jgi:hypothetical protein